jgi:hypothetical protein
MELDDGHFGAGGHIRIDCSRVYSSADLGSIAVSCVVFKYGFGHIVLAYQAYS